MAQRQNVLAPPQPVHNSKLFLSWGGQDALHIAKWLKKEVFDRIPWYDKSFVSDEIHGGDAFTNVIHAQLESATRGIGIMTDVSLDRPWFLYECSFLRSKTGQIPILAFCDHPEPSHPLGLIQCLDGFQFSSLESLVSDLMPNHEEITRQNTLKLLATKRAAWTAFTKPLKQRYDQTRDLRAASVGAIESIRAYKTRGDAAQHPCMKSVACKTLDDLAVAFNGLVTPEHSGQRTYKIEYRRYPEYLMHLQKTLNVSIHAIAIVDDMEEYWAQRIGDAILESTHSRSQRIFVFNTPELFETYQRHVFPHALRYDVWAMSAATLERLRDRIDHDFSIIRDERSGDLLAAYYQARTATVHFSTEPSTIEQRRAVFDHVLRFAHKLEPPGQPGEWSSYAACASERIFQHRPAIGQHSSVIPIETYDAFEEEHPFYREMQNCMLREFRERVRQPEAELRVLEVGAGTGLFTKRLMQQPFPRMSIAAMEPDSEAHPLLHRKLQCKAHRVQVVEASILTYTPPGEFRAVFSSFSEHHIRPEDKGHYFSTIKGLLEPGGLLVIGDEFLPPYNPSDPASYDCALESYHNYIIDRAKDAHCFEVAELERLAMESGRPSNPSRIDFKVNLDWYKKKAHASGLLLVAEHCITPAAVAPDIGGMYVLVYRKP